MPEELPKRVEPEENTIDPRPEASGPGVGNTAGNPAVENEGTAEEVMTEKEVEASPLQSESEQPEAEEPEVERQSPDQNEAQVVAGSAPEAAAVPVVAAAAVGTAAFDHQLAQANGMSDAELRQLRASEPVYSWQAAEYVVHHKGLSWYVGLFGGLAVLVGVMALLQYWTTLLTFVVMGAAVWVYAHKPPRTLTYELKSDGITIEDKFRSYKEFRSFGVLPEADWHTIDLEPVKRFSPRITILFGDNDFEDIVSHLELHLPRIDRKPDLIERVTRYLRF